MDTRSPSRNRAATAREPYGATSVQMLVVLVPVVFGLMGFAVDLGRIYMARAELKVAANAMALAAAGRLIGTESAVLNADSAAMLAIESGSGFGNKYDYGGLAIGETTGFLNSQAPAPAYYDSAASAIGEGDSAGAPTAGSTSAKYARVTLGGDVPLVFWGFLPLAQERKVPVWTKAVAGVSAPLCTACGIEPLAIQAIDATDTTNFGFIPGSQYTFYFQCTGQPTPGILQDTVGLLPYIVIDRSDQDATLFADESSQLYRIGAQGLPPSTTATKACLSISTPEQIWTSLAPVPCRQIVPPGIVAMLCGMASRFDSTPPDGCQNVPEIDAMSTIYAPDTDISGLADYTAYLGNTRRVITLAVVESIAAVSSLNILGFRQFVVNPASGSTNIVPTESNGRFAALYAGSSVPLRQGRFDGCQQTAGPGKVVLHQ